MTDAIHLVQPMRDVDHRHAARHQPRDQRKQLIDFARCQCGRRLVHHEDRRRACPSEQSPRADSVGEGLP